MIGKKRIFGVQMPSQFHEKVKRIGEYTIGDIVQIINPDAYHHRQTGQIEYLYKGTHDYMDGMQINLLRAKAPGGLPVVIDIDEVKLVSLSEIPPHRTPEARMAAYKKLSSRS